MVRSNSLLAYLTPFSVLGGIIGLGLFLHLFARVQYYIRFRRNGGVHASRLAGDPFTSFLWLYSLAKAQLTNRMYPMFESVFEAATPKCPDLVEVSFMGTSRMFFTKSPNHIKAILTSKFSDYGKGRNFHRLFEPYMGNSVFTTDAELWQEARNLLRPMFIRNRISDLHCFERGAIALMSQFPEDGQSFDVMDLFYRMTIDTICDFLFGASINSLENPENKFMKAFNELQRFQTTISLLGAVEKFIPRGKYNSNIKIINDFLDTFIDQALSLPQDELQKINKSEMSFTFLHALAIHTRDRKVIRDQLNSVLLAGRDTTGATLSWCFFELMQKPKIWAKLRSEVLSTVGPDRIPTYEDLKNMKYLDRTIHETLRLYPAVPYNVRFALRDSTLPSTNPDYPDITTVKGDAVFYSPYAMQRCPGLYPSPSEKFAPVDQFSPERWEHWQPRPWQYVPFNGGPRICVGQQFAITEMAYILTRILQRYERLEARCDPTTQFLKFEIVGTPGRPILVAMHKSNTH